jgi:hypothetical protein
MPFPNAGAEWRRAWKKLGLGPAINGDPIIVYQSAQLLYGRGEHKAAEGAFREVLDRDPKHLGALEWLACLLQNQRHFAEADAFRQRKKEVEAELAREKDEAREKKDQPADPTGASAPSPETETPSATACLCGGGCKKS